MTYEDENQDTGQESKPSKLNNLNRIVTILFVLAIHVFIFLKIIFLE